MTQITTLEQLRELYSMPAPLVVEKDVHHIDQHSRTFIEHSTLMFLATEGKDGFMDLSPRGGRAGFIKVLDDQTIAFPDSPGNNRLDTLSNVLANPKVGVLCMVPGIDEIVRIKGIASVHIDEELRQQCLDGKTKPKLVVKITVEDLFFHCPKALMLSKIWSSDEYQDRSFLPSLLAIIKDQQVEKKQRSER